MCMHYALLYHSNWEKAAVRLSFLIHLNIYDEIVILWKTEENTEKRNAMLMLKQVRMIDPATKVDEIRDILISDGKIVKSGEDLAMDAPLIARAKGEKLQVLDCTGKIAAPGLIDVHVHLREPGFTHKEDIMSGAKTAARGGITTVIAMANTNPPVDNEETALFVLHQGRKAPIRIRTCSTLTVGMKGEELVSMKKMKDAGVAGFTDDGMPVTNAEVLLEGMKTARKLKLPLSFHEEDPKYVKESGVNHGKISKEMGLHGAEARAEYSMVERDCKMARETGATVSIQHISAKESVEFVRRAKKTGARVFAEAAPHHFSLTEDAVLQYGTLAKMNPPLRTEEDRMAIIQGLKDNTIEIIATDHAPHSDEEKARSFTEAPSGILGFETLLPLGLVNLVEPGHLSMMQWIGKMTYEPAKLYALEGGNLKDDAVADIVVFDPNEEWIYDKSFSKSNNSPFLGSKLKGKVKYTICAGKIVYRDDEE